MAAPGASVRRTAAILKSFGALFVVVIVAAAATALSGGKLLDVVPTTIMGASRRLQQPGSNNNVTAFVYFRVHCEIGQGVCDLEELELTLYELQEVGFDVMCTSLAVASAAEGAGGSLEVYSTCSDEKLRSVSVGVIHGKEDCSGRPDHGGTIGIPYAGYRTEGKDQILWCIRAAISCCGQENGVPDLEWEEHEDGTEVTCPEQCPTSGAEGKVGAGVALLTVALLAAAVLGFGG